MSGRPRPVLIGVLAIATAIGIWVLAADSIRRSITLEPQEIESLLVLLVTACLLDAFIAYRAIRGRVGVAAYAWLGLRILVSAAVLLLVTLPSYVVAVVAFSRRRDTEPMDGSSEPSEPDEPVETTPGPHA